MGDASQPTWHWDEQAALRAELADQAEVAAELAAALRAEVARLEAEAGQLRDNVEFWRGRADAFAERARQLRRALALATGQ